MQDRSRPSDAKAGRRIGIWGTASRLILGGLFVSWAVSMEPGPADVVIGLVVFPAAVIGALSLRGRKAPSLRLTGPEGHALNIAIWSAAFLLLPVPTLLFGGAAQLLAAARGYAGCELFAVSNWLRRRDNQIGCPVHSLVDAAEARTQRRRTGDQPPLRR